jgi:hypothetical protein
MGTTRMGLRGWLRSAGAGEDAASGEAVDQLEREVALLREENARLKVTRERADRPVNERVRAMLSTPRGEGDPDADEPWEILTECMLLRDGLVDACRELERGARELRGRLETLLPNAEGEGAAACSSDDLEGVA